MRFLALIGFFGIVAAIGAAAFFFGGYYSVAGTAPEPAIVKWALINVRTASIARYANDTPPMPLDDSAVKDGARAYAARGCVNCHGAPGVNWAKFSEGLRPDPPDLKYVAKERTPAQLFWVIKNGINMTGMPSFGLIEAPDKEIWTIAAFVKKMPDVSEADYKAWTAPSAPPASPAPSTTSEPSPPAPPATTEPPAPATPPVLPMPGPNGSQPRPN